jgi:uncharacterized protein
MNISYFNGLSVLITGASAGIGAEFARQLAPMVSRMVLIARRSDRLDALRSEFSEVNPRLELFTRCVDLCNQDELERFSDWLAQSGLAIDLLVNNAGLGDHGPFIDSQWQRVSSVLDVNMRALTYLTLKVLPGMRKSGRGAVLNVSSTAGFLPLPNNAVYAATKAYVTSFSEAIRAELRSSNITVTTLCPGPVSTEYLSQATRPGDHESHTAPDFFIVPVQEIVRQALQALAKDRARVVPGAFVNFSMTIIAFVPMFVKRLVYRARLGR